MKRALVAVIDESRCIGCTLCIDACPVDAIVGAAQLMHTSPALNRAAGERGRQRKRRLRQETMPTVETDRRKILAAALELKKAR